jgi:hypothetical protein
VLILCTIANIVWIALLCITLKKRVLRGSEFILGGPGAGFVATSLKFFVAQQAMNIGQIIPYRSMHADYNDNDKRNVGNIIDAGYNLLAIRMAYFSDFYY